MARKYKPYAWVYEDGGGVCAQHCRNKEQALKVMQEAVDELENRVVVTLEDIEVDRAYSHRNCDGQMIGKPICWGCGESCSPIGRKVFIYNNQGI